MERIKLERLPSRNIEPTAEEAIVYSSLDLLNKPNKRNLSSRRKHEILFTYLPYTNSPSKILKKASEERP